MRTILGHEKMLVVVVVELGWSGLNNGRATIRHKVVGGIDDEHSPSA
jgi:hypothetical protein